MTTVNTAARRRHHSRHHADLDPTLVRNFIYRLHDAGGICLYIGRSCDVPRRLKAHYSDARHPYNPRAAEKWAWLQRVRSVSMIGPFDWNEACRVERREIEAHQPEGNRQFTTAHGYRPLSEGGGQYFLANTA